MVFGRFEPFTILKSARFSLAIVALANLAGGSALLWFSVHVHSSYKGYPDAHQMLVISPGLSVPQIGGVLESRGIIRSGTIFEWYVRLAYGPTTLKAGEYQFQGAQNLAEVAEKLRLGQIYYHSVLIPEGLTMDETVDRFAREDFGSAERFEQMVHDGALISDLDPEAENLEGYLFPDTYFVTRGVDAAEIIRGMVQSFRRQWTPRHLQRAQELNLTIRQVVTLASLIEKETGVPDERPLISAVFHNRLQKNIKLECDPTVIYAVKLVKEYDGVINQSDLRLDSPYNTYLYPGLPPGPIASPGAESIEAALYPADVSYLYFVAKKIGGHSFSTRYSDHRRAVEEYRRQ